MRRWTLIVALAAIVALPGLSLAQEQDTSNIMWMSFVTTKSGKGMDFVEMMTEYDAPMYDELLANGSISSWGITIPINHRINDTWNNMIWVSMDDWSNVGDLQGGFMKMFASRTPEQAKMLEEKYREMTEPGTHFDWIAREQVNVFDEKGLQSNYFGMSYWRAHPGKSEVISDFYNKHMVPMYAKLLADGVITGYGMFVPELHTDPSFTHAVWYSMVELGAMDKVHVAIDAGLEDVDLGPVMQATDFDAHWDQVLLIAHMGGRPAGEDN